MYLAPMKICTRCKEEKELELFYRKRGDRAAQCKACTKKYDQSNKEAIRERRRLFYKSLSAEEKQRRLDRANIVYKNRMQNDPIFALKIRVRDRTRHAFKFSKWHKKGTSEELMGVDYETAFKHIESQFTEGMSWENRHLWHIDHIIPLSSANTEEELIKLCHYTNLQPLWAEDNLKKGCSILPKVQ